jgi:hypothetical protein
MDSLTTAYLVCMLIGSASAVGGAMAGNKFAPIESSSVESISLPKVESATPAAPLQNTAQTAPEVSSTAQ